MGLYDYRPYVKKVRNKIHNIFHDMKLTDELFIGGEQ